MKKNKIIIWIVCLVFAAGAFLAGCSDDDNSNVKYRVTIVNLTAHQPFSPVAVILHKNGYTPWRFGQAASAGLEQLAEGGNPDGFISEANSHQDVMDTVAGTSPVSMGASGVFEVMAWSGSDNYLTVAAMLVNTNDAITGVNSVKVSELAVGESMTLFANAMDAGTEENSETMSDIPGPAAGGEGFNAARDDQDIVTVHPGVVTADDGLMTSILDESYRWDNPVAKISVMRLD